MPTIGWFSLSPAPRPGPCFPTSLWSGNVLTAHSSRTSGWRFWGPPAQGHAIGRPPVLGGGLQGASRLVATCLLAGMGASAGVRDCLRDCKAAAVWHASLFFLIQFKADSKSLSHRAGKKFNLRRIIELPSPNSNVLSRCRGLSTKALG